MKIYLLVWKYNNIFIAKDVNLSDKMILQKMVGSDK
jgi:hypothetical protein